jgi:hypothetical protein
VKNTQRRKNMKERKILMTAVAVMLALAVNVVPATAKETQDKLVIGNGTGGEMTALIITPAKARYPGNQNRLAFQGLNVSDGSVFAVTIPEQFKGIDTFDIEIISKGRRYVTKKGIKINLESGRIPTLELSRAGKDSTRALAGAVADGAGGVVAVAATATALYTGTIVFRYSLGAAKVLFDYILTLAWGIAGGGILSDGGIILGISVLAIPVALGIGGFLFLTPGGLDAQVYYN